MERLYHHSACHQATFAPLATEWGRGQVSGEVKMRPEASIWGDPEDLGSNTMKPIAGGLFTPLFNKYFLSDYFVMDAGAPGGE